MSVDRAYLLWMRRPVPLLLAAASVGACTHGSTEPRAPFLAATVTGEFRNDYTGSGTFSEFPATVRTPIRFTLFSSGTGASAGRTFHFLGVRVPAAGSHPVLAMPATLATPPGDGTSASAGSYHAFYSVRRDETIVDVYSARSGTITVSTSAASRLSGSFEMSAAHTAFCTFVAGFPGDRADCQSVNDGAQIFVQGVFDAGALGGENPGLIPSPRSAHSPSYTGS